MASLQPPRPRAQARLDRHADRGRRDARRRRRRRRGRAGRGRRDRDPRPQRDEGLLATARTRPPRRSRRRLVPHRRHRPRRRGRLLLHRRPQEGPDHPRRLQRLPARDRGGALRAPGGRRGRRGRRPARRRSARRSAPRSRCKPGATPTPEELRDYVKEQVAAYKYPRHVWLVDALPKGPTGKILKREIDVPAEVAAEVRVMSADRRQPPTGGRAASRAALDVLLTDAAIEPGASAPRAAADRRAAGRRPGPPPAPRGAARRRPRRRARPDRGRRLARSRRPRATAASPTAPGRENSAVPPADAGLPRARGQPPTGWSTTPGWTGATTQRARFMVDNLLDARRADEHPAAPTRRCSRRRSTRGGANLVTGGRAASSRDCRQRAGCRRWSTRARSRSAATSRVSAGAVVLRTEVFELIQYRPHDRARSTRRRC